MYFMRDNVLYSRDISKRSLQSNCQSCSSFAPGNMELGSKKQNTNFPPEERKRLSTSNEIHSFHLDWITFILFCSGSREPDCSFLYSLCFWVVLLLSHYLNYQMIMKYQISEWKVLMFVVVFIKIGTFQLTQYNIYFKY